MATATALPPPTVHDAARALSAARERVREHQRVYDKLRHRREVRQDQGTPRAHEGEKS
jgi:hypothetical protein